MVGSLSALRVSVRLLFLLFGVCLAHGQFDPPRKQIHLHGVPMLIARSADSSDILAAAVATVLQDKNLCCGKDSALSHKLWPQDTGSPSLKDIGKRLQGRYQLADGRTIVVTAEYQLPQNVIAADQVIALLKDNHPPLVMWNSQVYVVYGVSYVESMDVDAEEEMRSVQKYFLWDTRYADARRKIAFDRSTQDIRTLQGFLFLDAKPE